MDENDRLYPKALPPRVRDGLDDPLLEARARVFWLLFVLPLVLFSLFALILGFVNAARY